MMENRLVEEHEPIFGAVDKVANVRCLSGPRFTMQNHQAALVGIDPIENLFVRDVIVVHLDVAFLLLDLQRSGTERSIKHNIVHHLVLVVLLPFNSLDDLLKKFYLFNVIQNIRTARHKIANAPIDDNKNISSVHSRHVDIVFAERISQRTRCLFDAAHVLKRNLIFTEIRKRIVLELDVHTAPLFSEHFEKQHSQIRERCAELDGIRFCFGQRGKNAIRHRSVSNP